MQFVLLSLCKPQTGSEGIRSENVATPFFMWILGRPLRLRHGAAISTGGRTLRTSSVIKATAGGAGNQSTFLSYEEAGLIEMSKLDMHERFLCRLTVSSLNLLRIISEQEGVHIEELNAGMICDWFQKDKEDGMAVDDVRSGGPVMGSRMTNQTKHTGSRASACV
ncbi:hypothetical protein R1flu_003504 [Riccia fluitans]|uniref:Uncharacterized protein n=1 Tax=Riccia fluitans TaxID=41844 RepID=A0ABD1YCV7_9MARC